MEKNLINLLNDYTTLTKNNNLSKLGETFSYYHADNLKTNLFVRDCVEIDIVSAFPTICNIIHNDKLDFINKLNFMDDKLDKNIFISTYLKDLEKQNNMKYLEELNNYCKLIIFSKVFNDYENITILEYKKDGILFIGNIKILKDHKIDQIFEYNNIKFKKNIITDYFRFNKTSVYVIDDILEIKGYHKNVSLYIKHQLFNIIKLKKIDNIKDKLSMRFYNFLKLSGLTQEIKYYFGDENITNPEKYIFEIIFPIMYLMKSC